MSPISKYLILIATISNFLLLYMMKFKIKKDQIFNKISGSVVNTFEFWSLIFKNKLFFSFLIFETIKNAI